MQFRVPDRPIEFDIPDEWLKAANAREFSPKTRGYLASSDLRWPTTLIRLSEIAAPVRNVGVRTLDEERTVSILRAITSGQTLPAIEADIPPQASQFKYRVRDGYHRFYVSVALGFSHLPLSIRPYFDIAAL